MKYDRLRRDRMIYERLRWNVIKYDATLSRYGRMRRVFSWPTASQFFFLIVFLFHFSFLHFFFFSIFLSYFFLLLIFMRVLASLYSFLFTFCSLLNFFDFSGRLMHQSDNTKKVESLIQFWAIPEIEVLQFFLRTFEKVEGHLGPNEASDEIYTQNSLDILGSDETFQKALV